jgi:hypothetical protein
MSLTSQSSGSTGPVTVIMAPAPAPAPSSAGVVVDSGIIAAIVIVIVLLLLCQMFQMMVLARRGFSLSYLWNTTTAHESTIVTSTEQLKSPSSNPFGKLDSKPSVRSSADFNDLDSSARKSDLRRQLEAEAQAPSRSSSSDIRRADIVSSPKADREDRDQKAAEIRRGELNNDSGLQHKNSSSNRRRPQSPTDYDNGTKALRRDKSKESIYNNSASAVKPEPEESYNSYPSQQGPYSKTNNQLGGQATIPWVLDGSQNSMQSQYNSKSNPQAGYGMFPVPQRTREQDYQYLQRQGSQSGYETQNVGDPPRTSTKGKSTRYHPQQQLIQQQQQQLQQHLQTPLGPPPMVIPQVPYNQQLQTAQGQQTFNMQTQQNFGIQPSLVQTQNNNYNQPKRSAKDSQQELPWLHEPPSKSAPQSGQPNNTPEATIGESAVPRPSPNGSKSTTVGSTTSNGLTGTTIAGTTIASTENELSIPGFLEYMNEIDFKFSKQIAKGGGGQIFLIKPINDTLKKFHKVVFKKLAGNNSVNLF